MRCRRSISNIGVHESKKFEMKFSAQSVAHPGSGDYRPASIGKVDPSGIGFACPHRDDKKSSESTQPQSAKKL